MEKITAWLKNGENDIYLEEGTIETNTDSRIAINNVSIYWRFRNIPHTQFEATLIDKTGHRTFINLKEGYWTFNEISELFANSSVNLKKLRHNNTCRIGSSKYEIKLGEHLGPLIGFKKNFVVTRGTLADSGEVDVNWGLRFVTIGCNIVNPIKNFDANGKRSTTIAKFPITTEQPLFNYVSYYKDVNFEAPVDNGSHNHLKFLVETNIEEEVEMNILAEFYFK